MNGRIIRLTVVTIAALLLSRSAARTRADKQVERTYPSIPGAVRGIPEWMAKNAPFDVAAYFKPIPAGENAAPLYLDAIYEFSPNGRAGCVSPW